MRVERRLTEVYRSAPRIVLPKDAKLVMMSDCHRGDGSWADNFANNQNLFFAALEHYFREGFTYIELGDGDELWENRSMVQIKKTYDHIFWLLSQFCAEGRLYLLYGNHDIVKRKKECGMKIAPWCDRFFEGLVLVEEESGKEFFLVHGHQGDLLNDTLWPLSRFLVRYVWKPLQLLGVYDPTSAAKNYKKKEMAERKLSAWVKKNGIPLLAGHTHRPALPEPGECAYFNDGSCVHPRCITCMEIQQGKIALVKWSVMTRSDRTLYVERTLLAGPHPLQGYWR